MTQYLIAFTLFFLCSNSLLAQTKTPSMEEIVKKQKAMLEKKEGILKFSFGNKSYSYHCQVISQKGVYLFTVAFTDDAESNINIILNSINEGKNYTVADDKKKISTAVINGNSYQIIGSVTLNKKGKTVSGSFEFEAFLIPKNSSKPDKKSEGKITGTITNVSIP